jgi:hypothetical protein
MEGALSASHFASHENPHGGYFTHLRPSIPPDDNGYKSSAGVKNESRAPMSIPIAKQYVKDNY